LLSESDFIAGFHAMARNGITTSTHFTF
jgi:hypothetical protein